MPVLECFLAFYRLVLFLSVEDRVGLFDLLLGLGLHHLAQPKAHPIQDLGPGTGRGQLLRALPLLSERLQCRLGPQPRVGYTVRNVGSCCACASAS